MATVGEVHLVQGQAPMQQDYAPDVERASREHSSDGSSTVYSSCISSSPPIMPMSFAAEEVRRDEQKVDLLKSEMADQLHISHASFKAERDGLSGKMQERPVTQDNTSDKRLESLGVIEGCSRYGRRQMNLELASEEPNSEWEAAIKESQQRDFTRPTANRGDCWREGRPLAIKRIGQYDLVRTLGAGSTGKVKLAVHQQTGELAAFKIVPRKQFATSKKSSKETVEARERRILREAAILNLIDHNNIVQLKDVLITTDYFCMLFEYIEGEQLLDYIISHGKLREVQARHFFRQILSAVDYCHHNSIVHRDLKIENIIVQRSGRIKLLDFGLSNFYDPNGFLNTFCGSLYFAAPELLSGQAYTGPEVDVWSLGIILYVLVCGRVPFDDKNLAALHDKIKLCALKIPDHISPECRHLLMRMICKQPKRRASMSEVLHHQWVNQDCDLLPAAAEPTERLPIDVVDEQVVNFLALEFQIQYTPVEIREILALATRDWAAAFRHPIVSLYFLAKEKMLHDGEGRLASLVVDEAERSRSHSMVSSSTSNPSLAIPIEARCYERLARKHSHPGALLSTQTRVTTFPTTKPAVADVQGEHEGPNPAPTQRRSSTIKGTDQGLTSSLYAPATTLTADRPRFSSVSSIRHDAAGSIETDESLGIKTVYFRGLFSVHTTSSKPPKFIRQRIQQVLILNHIHFEDCKSHFICQHTPSIQEGDNFELFHKVPLTIGPVRFEIQIVKLALIGLHGIQFHRLQGNSMQYKNLCSQLLLALQL